MHETLPAHESRRATTLGTAALMIAIAGTGIAPDQSKAQQCTEFNCYMRSAAEKLVADRGNRGWCHNGTFTRNLPYASMGLSISRNPAGSCKGNTEATSCNGAVFEVIAEALSRYSKTPNAARVSIPLATWNSTSLKDIRANIFLFEPRQMAPFSEAEFKLQGRAIKFNKDDKLQDFSPDLRKRIRAFESKSIAHGLARFGLADNVHIPDMTSGDVLTFNRDVTEVANGVPTKEPTGSQHSVIFLGWVDKEQKSHPTYAGAYGFKYMSSQSNPGGKSGFGIRWAYFSGFCPQDPENKVKVGDRTSCPDQRKADDGSDGPNFPRQLAGQKSDCCVIKKDGGLTNEGMKVGRIRDPAVWSAAYSVAAPTIAKDLASLETLAKAERHAWIDAKRREAMISSAVARKSTVDPARIDAALLRAAAPVRVTRKLNPSVEFQRD